MQHKGKTYPVDPACDYIEGRPPFARISAFRGDIVLVANLVPANEIRFPTAVARGLGAMMARAMDFVEHMVKELQRLMAWKLWSRGEDEVVQQLVPTPGLP